MPERIAPMLSRTGRLPRDDRAWGHEIKWDGIRSLLFCERGDVRLQGRNFADFTPRYPEICRPPVDARSRRMVLDGELVAFDEQGRPSFERLQSRMHLASAGAVRRRLAEVPVTYVGFDLLWIEGRSTMPLSYEHRRRLLEQLELDGGAWRVPIYHRGDGRAVLEGTARLGVEGIVAKRLDCPYEPGRRSAAWVKVKNLCSQSVVIGGFTPGAGLREGAIGALAVGIHEGDRLLYAGKVGTGFTEATLAGLAAQLGPLRRVGSPFASRQPPRDTRFVEPRLVAEVEFREWTRSGTLRAPSFKGLRPDVDPLTVVREPQLRV